MQEDRRQDELERLLDEGERLFYSGRYDEALARFERAIELDEDDADAHYLRGRTFFYMGRDDESISALDRALDIDPDFVVAIVHKAELLVRAFGWTDEALDLLDEAEETGLSREEKVDASMVRGLAHVERGEYRKALEYLNRAVRGDAEWMEARRERGICRFYLWRFRDASSDFELVLENDQADAETHYCLAMCKERMGDQGHAEIHFARAAELDPQSFHLPLRLSRTQFSQIAEQALEELPEEFRIRFDNVGFMVEDFPECDPDTPPDLLGQFQGSSLSDRPGASYIEPAQVLLFQKNLERAAMDLATLKDEIGRTVLHEVGHFFGLNEDDMVRLEIH